MSETNLQGVCRICGQGASANAFYCPACRNKLKTIAGIEANKRRRARYAELKRLDKARADAAKEQMPPKFYPVTGSSLRTTPCEKCKVLFVCQAEIWRPSFWPPCTPESKFYDIELARKVNYGHPYEKEIKHENDNAV